MTFRSTAAAEELRAFVDGTDLGSRSLYLLKRPVSACYEARLVDVYRDDDSVAADLYQSLRPTGFLCSVNGVDTVGIGIRLPFPWEGIDDHGWSWLGEYGSLRTVASESDEGQ